MGILNELGIVKKKPSKTARIFESLIPNFFEIEYNRPSEYISKCWRVYQKNYPEEDPGTNGLYFEFCISTLLIREKILPFYIQAEIAFVPNIRYDFILYSRELGPICLSSKTSLRERYKQADLEAMALKNVHRKSKSYLITLNQDEAENLQNKIADGGAMGLDGCIYVLSAEFDAFVRETSTYSLQEAGSVNIVESQKIITDEIVEAVSLYPHKFPHPK